MIYPGIFFDIETGKSARAEEFMPEFKEPKIKKDGQPYANSKSIAEQVEEWEADCALSPITGRILCIGYAYEHGERIIAGADDENEEFILRDFWKKYSDRDLLYLVGWNINRFDLPFIYKRSLILGVKPPINPIERSWNMTIDLQEVFNRFVYGEYTKLDHAARAMGFGSKLENGEVSKHFQRYWNGTPEMRKTAVSNVLNDLELTSKMGGALL